MVQFKPYSFAIQTRFKWRHKETDKWRRLMDGTCFSVDWLSQTVGPTMSQYGGHWSHILTCAHVVCPWQYPNFYPPTGHTRFVSHVTLPDTQIQVRAASLQGQIVYRHFVSNNSVFVHTNPRLDLCVVHPEQMLLRSGELKMLWMQNEGYVMRPRLELNEELKVGDYVWIYGLTAHESLFDEEKAPEPLMVPTGIRARVHTKTKEHFFLDTMNVEGSERGKVHMGMCGSVIMRNGRCVGMLTATVHEESACKELAGTAMCTYSSDIFEFLLEVEKQMKNRLPSINGEPTRFEERREAEGTAEKVNKDWSLDHTRIARHIECPRSLWRMEQNWVMDEDKIGSQLFGKSGAFNQETQENVLGQTMNSSTKDGKVPEGFQTMSNSHPGKSYMQGERPDGGPRDVYTPHEAMKDKSEMDMIGDDLRSMFDANADGVDDVSVLSGLRQSIEGHRIEKERRQMRENVFKHAESRSASSGFTDPLGVGNAGHYGGAGAGQEKFSSEAVDQDRQWRAAAAKESAAESEKVPHVDVDATVFGKSNASAGGSGGFEQRWEGGATKTSATMGSNEPPRNSAKEERARKKREKEAAYQAALRERHSQYQPDATGEFSRH